MIIGGLRDLMNEKRDMTYVDTCDVSPGTWQVRKIFTEQEELNDSIRAHGVLEPILLHPLGQGKYSIIGGERRWRAAKELGITSIPARILHVSDDQALQISLVENIQRSSLSAVEEARGYQAMLNKGVTQEVVARAVGKSRSHVANALRLLTLPLKVQEMVESNQISVGQARAIIGLGDCEAKAEEILAQKVTVRELETRRRDKSYKTPRELNCPPIITLPDVLPNTIPTKTQEDDEDDESDLSDLGDLGILEAQLAQALGMSVEMTNDEKGHLIKIRYKSWGQVDALLERLAGC